MTSVQSLARATALALVPTVVFVLLAGCAVSPGVGGGTECADFIPNVRGCERYSLSGVSAGAPDSIVSSGSIFVRTGKNQVIVETGCNTVNFEGIVDGDAFTVNEVSSGLMICDSDRTANEAWITEFFSETTRWTTENGSLVVASDSGYLMLTR